MCLLYGFGEAQHVSVAQAVGVSGIEAVAQSVHELQFGSQLEERQVEVAAESHLSAYVVAFEADVVGALAAEIYHRVDTGYEVRTVVVEPRGCEYEVECGGDVHRLEILVLLSGLAFRVEVGHVAERYVAISEVKRWSHTELEISAYAVFAHHTHVESRVPAVLVGCDKSLYGCAVLVCNDLRTGVQQFEILQMSADDHSEVERAEVCVRSVLHRARLR